MKKYIKFFEKHGPGKFYEPIDIDALDSSDKYLLTNEILDILINDGVSSYIDGLFWTLNPSEYSDWLNEWLPFEDRSIPFARSAFGDILFIRQKQIMVLNSSLGIISGMSDVDDIDLFMNRYLTDSWFFDTFFNGDIFNELADKTLMNDECFGFHPLLSLGGTRDSQNVKRVKMKEHLDIVSKSSEGVKFYSH